MGSWGRPIKNPCFGRGLENSIPRDEDQLINQDSSIQVWHGKHRFGLAVDAFFEARG
jgi:hypothetical protein